MPGSNSRPNVSEGYEVPTELPGSTVVYKNADLPIEVDRRVRNAGCSFRKYNLELYDRPSAPLELKIRMLRAEVLETMLYGCVMWSPRACHYDTLRRAHHRFLTRCIGWRKHNIAPTTRIIVLSFFFFPFCSFGDVAFSEYFFVPFPLSLCLESVCCLPIHSGHQVRWTYQPGSHRRKVTQDFSSTFFLRCVP